MQRNYADTLLQCHWHCYFAFHAGAQATCAINNVVHLQNQLGESSSQPSHHRVASALSSPQQFCPQTAEEPDENSHAEASSSPASQPVVCSQYRVSNSKYACISYMHKMHQDAEISNSKYARICSTKYAENIHHCTNEIGNIYVLCASIYKNMQITIMHLYANIHICTNMHF